MRYLLYSMKCTYNQTFSLKRMMLQHAKHMMWWRAWQGQGNNTGTTLCCTSFWGLHDQKQPLLSCKCWTAAGVHGCLQTYKWDNTFSPKVLTYSPRLRSGRAKATKKKGRTFENIVNYVENFITHNLSILYITHTENIIVKIYQRIYTRTLSIIITFGI